MDLISRKEVRRLIWRNNDKYGYSDRFHEFTDEVLNNLPSAFEGMTNGEVMKAVFPNAEVTMPREPLLPTSNVIVDYDENYHNYYRLGWWNSPYKGVSE